MAAGRQVGQQRKAAKVPGLLVVVASLERCNQRGRQQHGDECNPNDKFMHFRYTSEPGQLLNCRLSLFNAARQLATF
jgi:hypothetical protein